MCIGSAIVATSISALEIESIILNNCNIVCVHAPTIAKRHLLQISEVHSFF